MQKIKTLLVALKIIDTFVEIFLLVAMCFACQQGNLEAIVAFGFVLIWKALTRAEVEVKLK